MKTSRTLVACAVAAALAAPAAQANPLPYGPATYLATGATPRVVLRADLDGSGFPNDLVSVNAGTNDLTVFLADARGVTRPLRLPVGAQPGRISAIDLDNDGRTDLAILNQGDATLQLLRNDGDGRFSTSAALPVGRSPDRQIAWKADALSRIVVSNGGENTISYFAFGPDGSPIGHRTLAVGRRPNAVQNIDLDGDALDELVVLNFDDGTVSIVERENTPTALPIGVVGTVAVGAGPLANSPAIDLDGDGRRDLAVANQADGTITVLKNRGDRTFATSTYRVGPAPGSVNAVDLDGDGYPDLIVGNAGGRTVSVLINRGDATFAEAVSYPVGEAPSFPASADIDGDSIPDLVVPSGDGRVSVLRGIGDGTFHEPIHHRLIAGVTPRGAAQFVDVVGDGSPSIAVALPSVHQIAILPNQTDAFVRVVEFARDRRDGSRRYFMTPLGVEIDALDSGAIAGWTRTGASFRAYARGGEGRVAMCRFYSVPLDTHFFTANPAECEIVARDHADVWGSPETRHAFHVLTIGATGCVGGSNPVYRLFDPAAVTHRTTPSRSVRDAMVGNAWIAEGEGPDGAAFCAP